MKANSSLVPSGQKSDLRRLTLIAIALVVFCFAPTASLAAGFTLTSPTQGSIVPAGQPITVTWTGGDPSANVALILIDVEAGAFAQGYGITSNTGSLTVTIGASNGTCGRLFQFYLEDSPRTTWTYGPQFTVVCDSAGPETVDLVLITKASSWVQSSASDPVINPRLPGPFFGGPYGFRVNVYGTNIAAMDAPIVTLPPGSLYPTEAPFNHNGGVLSITRTTKSGDMARMRTTMAESRKRAAMHPLRSGYTR